MHDPSLKSTNPVLSLAPYVRVDLHSLLYNELRVHERKARPIRWCVIVCYDRSRSFKVIEITAGTVERW